MSSLSLQAQAHIATPHPVALSIKQAAAGASAAASSSSALGMMPIVTPAQPRQHMQTIPTASVATAVQMGHRRANSARIAAARLMEATAQEATEAQKERHRNSSEKPEPEFDEMNCTQDDEDESSSDDGQSLDVTSKRLKVSSRVRRQWS
jgi:hypothetical protein